MRHPKINLTPRRAVYPRQIIWLLVGVGAVSALLFGAWSMAKQIEVTPAQRYTGVFESTAQNAAVVLPAGVTVSTMMVAEGASVEKGQKLARYDQAALEELITLAQTQLTQNENLRRCLLDNEAAANVPRDTFDTQQAQATLPAATAMALCYNMHRRNRLAREHLMHRRDSLRHETALAIKELTLRANATKDPVQTILKLRAAIEETTLATAIREAEFELALLQETQQQALLTQVQTLEAEASALTKRLVHLEALYAMPWLRAPQDGRLERVRDLVRQPARDVETVLAQILDPRDQTYTAFFDVPQAQAHLLSLGQLLEVRLAGLPQAQPAVLGRVAAISNDTAQSTTAARIEVTLHPEGLAPQFSTILTALPDGTRSNMEVALPPRPLTDIMQAVVRPITEVF